MSYSCYHLVPQLALLSIVLCLPLILLLNRYICVCNKSNIITVKACKTLTTPTTNNRPTTSKSEPPLLSSARQPSVPPLNTLTPTPKMSPTHNFNIPARTTLTKKAPSSAAQTKTPSTSVRNVPSPLPVRGIASPR